MPTTIRDVARAAGVSPATVSRVLNGHTDVAAELADRVRAAVDALRYRPSGVARGLRRRATMVLGAIVSDVTNPFFTTLVRGIEDVAQAGGYSVVLANSDEDLAKEKRYLGVAAAERFAGVIVSPTSTRRTDLGALHESGVPVVTVDRRLPAAALDSVTVDDRAAALAGTRHLLDQDCRRIGLVAGPLGTTTARDRLAGYRDALAGAGRPYDAELVTRGDFRIGGGHAAVRRLLARSPRLDGLFVSNNLMAIGALDALDEAGLSCPADVGVVSVGAFPAVAALRSRLAIVGLPSYEIGRCAAALLLRRIRGERFPPEAVVLPATLTVGEHARRGGDVPGA